jgi:hypothetical protein
MEVSCPRCRANLLLPADVVGASVCCPTCKSVFRAESGRLIATEGISLPPAPPQPASATALPPDDDDESLDLAVPPGHVFPGQRNVETLRYLSWVGLWMRIVAAVDLVSVFLIVALASLAPGGRESLSVAGVLCGLLVVGPVATLLWIAGGRMQQVRLHGSVHQPALMIGVLFGLLTGVVVLFTLPEMFRNRLAPNASCTAVLIAGGVGAANLLISVLAIVTRRRAIAAHLPERIADRDAGQGGTSEDLSLAALPPVVSPYQIARGAARGLRLASLMLVLWYPAGFCCCTGFRGEAPMQLVVLLCSGLPLLGTMLAAAYNLEKLQRRGIVIAGSIAALLVALGFFIDFLVGLVQLHNGPFDLRVVFLRIGTAFIVGLSGLLAGINCWQAVHNPGVRRAFRA